jgi:histidinol-phosphatase
VTSTSELLDAAVELAEAAGELTMQWFNQPHLEVEIKGDGSPVTAADRAAEELIRSELSKRFPGDAVVGEEFPDTPGTTGRTWYIDPIDGTKSFTHGVPLYATLIGITDAQGPCVGVAGIPALDEMVWAGRGLGCFHNGTLTRVSSVERLADACLTMSGLEYWPEPRTTAVADSGALVRTWGDGYGYVLVATGRAEAMIDPGLNPWDVAPMNVIIPEAGGVITHFDGAPVPFEGDVVASNGAVHQQVLDLISGPR